MQSHIGENASLFRYSFCSRLQRGAHTRASVPCRSQPTQHTEESYGASGAPTADGAEVALGAADGHGVEADDRDEETNAHIGQPTACKGVFAREHLLKLVEGREERHDGGLLRLLRRRGLGLVHLVYAARGAVSTGSRGRARRGMDDHALEEGDAPALILGARLDVGALDALRAVEGVRVCVGEGAGGGEQPACPCAGTRRTPRISLDVRAVLWSGRGHGQAHR